eukprot:scaffold29390_cov67-Cyclotella_meneghiniana.AAC.1
MMRQVKTLVETLVKTLLTLANATVENWFHGKGGFEISAMKRNCFVIRVEQTDFCAGVPCNKSFFSFPKHQVLPSGR